MTIIGAFVFEALLMALVWLAFGLLNFWIWSKAKNNAQLLMMIGGAAIGLAYLILTFSNMPDKFVSFYLPLIGAIVILVGYYMSVQSQVAEQMAGVKAKMAELKEKTAEKSGGDDS